jgi:hypothetical protein
MNSAARTARRSPRVSPAPAPMQLSPCIQRQGPASRCRSPRTGRRSISYDDALRQDIDWAVRAVADAEASGGSWQDIFPGMVARYGLDGWFPYAAEDTYIG